MILIAGIAALATTAQAQYIRFVPEAGFNVSNIRVRERDGRETRSYSGDPKLGLKIGGSVDIGISQCFSIQPGLFFSQKGYTLDENPTGGIVINRENAWRKATFNYLEMPLNLMFKFGSPRYPRFFIGGGGYLAYGVSGKVKYGPYAGQSGTTTRDLEFGTSETNDDYRNADVGGQLFAGVLMPFGGFIRAQYQGGIANIDPAQDDDYKVHNATASLTFGIMVGGHDHHRGHHGRHRSRHIRD